MVAASQRREASDTSVSDDVCAAVANPDVVADARIAPHFAFPPYRAELFYWRTGWAGVMNAHGINCLSFASKPGAVVSTLADCEAIAAKWNGDG